MPYLLRNQPPSQRKVHLDEGVVPISRVSGTKKKQFINPYVGKVRLTPYELVTLLCSLHQQKGFTLKYERVVYINDAKKLLLQYGSERSCTLMLLAAEYAKHPWSFQFISKVGGEHFLEERSELSKAIEGITL